MTQHSRYTIVNLGQGRALISGHAVFCPDAVPVRIEGSTRGGSMLKVGFIGRGMHLTFTHPTYGTIRTSRILEIQSAAQSKEKMTDDGSKRAQT